MTLVDITDTRPLSIHGLLPQSHLVLSSRDSQDVSSDGPADVPNHIVELVQQLGCPGVPCWGVTCTDKHTSVLSQDSDLSAFTKEQDKRNGQNNACDRAVQCSLDLTGRTAHCQAFRHNRHTHQSVVQRHGLCICRLKAIYKSSSTLSQRDIMQNLLVQSIN